MTLTFLILAGQVKVKGQLGEMAKCLEDEDKRIADLARMFFTELATKDNAVYNHFVDIFSLLSSERNLEEASLRRIIKFLAGFVEKVSQFLQFKMNNNSVPNNAKQTSSNSRKNTQNNLPTNWLRVLLVAKLNDNGMMWPMHCRYCNIRMRKLPKLSVLVSELSLLLLSIFFTLFIYLPLVFVIS